MYEFLAVARLSSPWLSYEEVKNPLLSVDPISYNCTPHLLESSPILPILLASSSAVDTNRSPHVYSFLDGRSNGNLSSL